MSETPATADPAARRNLVLRIARVALLSVTLLLAAKGIHSLLPAEERAPGLSEVPLPQVRLLKLQAEPIRQRIERYGRLLPGRQWSLTTDVPGRVVARPVENGAGVAPGALLIALDPAPFAAERAAAAAVVSEATASLSLARTRLKRLKQMAATTTKDELDQAAASRDRAEASLGAARARLAKAAYQLAHCRLVAPASGVVSGLAVEVGDYVMPGQALGRLSQVESLLIKLLVPGDVRRGVEVGQAAQVIDGEAREHRATLARAAPVPSGETGQFELELAVDNRAGALLAGEPVRCRLSHGGARPRLRVPRAAVYEEYGLWRALVPPPQPPGDAPFLARSVPVELGEGDPAAGWVEVLKGLAPGDTLLVPDRVAALREGQRVRLGPGSGTGWWPAYAEDR